MEDEKWIMENEEILYALIYFPLSVIHFPFLRVSTVKNIKQHPIQKTKALRLSLDFYCFFLKAAYN